MPQLKVLDTSAILGSVLSCEGKYLAPSSVLQEVKDEKSLLLVEVALREGKLEVCEPLDEARSRVLEAAKHSGNSFKLSQADVDVLALALERGAEVLTDDYSIQNLATELGIGWAPVRREGIKERRRWILRCAGCGRSFSKALRLCPSCGSEVRPKRLEGSRGT